MLGSILSEHQVVNVTAIHSELGAVATAVYYAPCTTGNVLNAVEWLSHALELYGVETAKILQGLVQKHCEAMQPQAWVVPKTPRRTQLSGLQLVPVFVF